MSDMKMTPFRATLLSVFASAFLSIISVQAQEILIDDFTTDISETTAWASYPVSGALGGHVGFSSPSNRVTYSVSGGVLRARNDEAVSSYLTVTYDGASGSSNDYALPDVDLTAGGQNTHLFIKVSSITTSEPEVGFRARVMTDSSNYFYHTEFTTGPGIVSFPLGSFEYENGTEADYTAAKAVVFLIFLEPGDAIEIDSFYAGSFDPGPDTERPSIKFLKKKKLKKPKGRHKITGTVEDNGTVDAVEAQAPGQGWRKAKLSTSGKWVFKTSKLRSGKNKLKFRARDSSGNISKIEKIKVAGK